MDIIQKPKYFLTKTEMKLIIFLIIYQITNFIVNAEGYSTNLKISKRMMPSVYADFVPADDTEAVGGENLGEEGQRTCNTQSSCGADISRGNSRQKATNIAQKAAQEAKAASDAQQEAGQAASRQAKMQLADRAMQAARAAEAALAGKQQIVEQLEQEVLEAEAVVQEQSASLQNAQQNVQAAVQAAQQAQSQLKTLTAAVQVAQSNVGNSEQAAAGAQQELAEKNELLDAAKRRIEQLLRQLNDAKEDLSNTKQAAYKAACAANEAKVNAQRARRHNAKRLTPQYKQQLQEQRQRQRLARRKPFYRSDLV